MRRFYVIRDPSYLTPQFKIITLECVSGNENLHILTSSKKYRLRIELEDYDGFTSFAEYSTFSIASSAEKYRLTVLGYYGNAGEKREQVR